MFAASKSAKAAAAGGGGTVTDPQINYVTTLLTGDGTNGQQNSTFVDSSANNATVTGYGNVTQGSAAPFGSNWSNFFNGTSDYLTVPASSAFAPGTGDFTVEGWFNVTGTLPNFGGVIYAQTVSGANYFVITAGNDAGPVTANYISLLTTTSGGGTAVYSNSSNPFTLNTWNHFAVVRSSGMVTVYLNGIGGTPTSRTIDLTNTSYLPTIGRTTHSGQYFPGYISNLRYVKGTAVYTANFTPSTTPLTAVTNTSLLTCQSPYFKDNSANAFAITVAGTPSVQRFSPFSPATAYDSAVYGGSIYFDGAGDYLSVPASTGTDFGTGNFTIEMWINPSSLSSYNMLYSVSSGSGYLCLIWGATTSVFGLNAYNGVELLNSSASTTPINQWTHIAFVRSSGTLYFYINGVASGSGAFGSAFGGSTGTVSIAYNPAYAGSYYTNAGISNLRVVKGTAVYTANFTPPTAPATAITNTQLLLKGINAGIYDSAMQTVFETAGNAQVSTTQKKYGTGSVYFDGTGDYLVTSANPQISVGTGDFTIECWFYTAVGTNNGIFQISDTAGGFKTSYGNSLSMSLSSGKLNTYGIAGTGAVSTGASYANSTWVHLAVVRSSGVTKIYANGVLDTTFGTSGAITDTTNYTGTYLVIGGYYSTGYLWNGYIDDFRITKGYARYTANFTPPATALPTS